MSKFHSLFLLAALCLTATFAKAEERIQIVATVSDEAITNKDLLHRLKIMIISVGAQGDPQAGEKLRPKALRDLVDEKMYIAAASKLGYKVEQSQIDEAIATLEGQNNMPSGELLNMLNLNDVPSQAMFDKLTADISQAYLVAREVTPKITIEPAEVDDFLNAESQITTRKEFQLQELVLPVDVDADEQKTLSLARELKQEFLSGKDFAELAAKHSKSPSKRNGGNVGWLDSKEVPQEILTAIKAQGTKKILGPIRSVEGYYLVIANDERTISSEGDNDLVELRSFSKTPKKSEEKQTQEKIASLNSVRKACLETEAYAKEQGVQVQNFGRARVGDLPSGIRNIIAGLETAEFSSPAITPQGFTTFLICERTKVAPSEPTEAQRLQAEELLKLRKAELAAKKYFRELRSTTNIDVRL